VLVEVDLCDERVVWEPVLVVVVVSLVVVVVPVVVVPVVVVELLGLDVVVEPDVLLEDLVLEELALVVELPLGLAELEVEFEQIDSKDSATDGSELRERHLTQLGKPWVSEEFNVELRTQHSRLENGLEIAEGADAFGLGHGSVGTRGNVIAAIRKSDAFERPAGGVDASRIRGLGVCKQK
jgi:hypothetical protein